MCIDEMMSLDGHGGTGESGALNMIPALERQASAIGHTPFYVGELCTAANSIARYGPDSVVLLTLPPAVLGSGAKHEL